jgi:hypothetical protein
MAEGSLVTHTELIEYLVMEGVHLTLTLDIAGPTSVLTDEMLEMIQVHKPMICEALAKELVWRSLKPLRWGDFGPFDQNLVAEKPSPERALACARVALEDRTDPERIAIRAERG